jgi:hypothetical protein
MYEHSWRIDGLCRPSAGYPLEYSILPKPKRRRAEFKFKGGHCTLASQEADHCYAAGDHGVSGERGQMRGIVRMLAW